MALWSDLKIKLIATGDETGTWGETTNANFNNVIEQAITGSATVTFADADVTLPLIDSTDLQNARALRLNLTGVVTDTRTLFVPNIQKFYLINNDLTEAITVQNTVGAGDAITIPAGRATLIFNDATDIVNPNTYFAGAVLSDAAVILGGAINATPIGGLSASTGNFTTLTLDNALAVAEGGTGVTTSTGTGNVVLSASPTLTGTPIAPTQTAGDNSTKIATTAYVATAVTNGLGTLGTIATQNANAVSITGGTITGITDLTVADGGTGSSSLAANNVLLGNGTSALQVVAPSTSGNVLTSDGTTWTSAANNKLTSGTVQNASSTSINFTGVPSWVKRITVLYENVSTTGTDPVQIQLGYGVTPTYVNTGYTSYTFSYNSTTATSSSTGFVNDQGSSSGGASASRNGAITLYLQNASTNTWVSSGVLVTSNVTPSAGRVTIPGTLTAVRITTTGGTQTFDVGSINIFYE